MQQPIELDEGRRWPLAALNRGKCVRDRLPTERRGHNDSASARIGCHSCATQRDREISSVRAYRPLNLGFLIGRVVGRAPQAQLRCEPLFRKHHVAEVLDRLADRDMEGAGTERRRAVLCMVERDLREPCVVGDAYEISPFVAEIVAQQNRIGSGNVIDNRPETRSAIERGLCGGECPFLACDGRQRRWR